MNSVTKDKIILSGIGAFVAWQVAAVGIGTAAVSQGLMPETYIARTTGVSNDTAHTLQATMSGALIPVIIAGSNGAKLKYL